MNPLFLQTLQKAIHGQPRVYVNYLNIMLYRQLGANRMWQSHIFYGTFKYAHTKMKPSD